MNTISVLDCTLRDGGWVNDFRFGVENMNEIEKALESSGISYIELGYLDNEKGSDIGRSFFADMNAVYKNGLLKNRKNHVKYLVMYDLGRYNVSLLPEKNENTVDGIRLCYHKKDKEPALNEAAGIMEKGYEVYIQPMVSTRYTDKEFLSMVDDFQKKLPKIAAIYIVDSFGAMSIEEVQKRMILTDSILNEDIAIGIHVHNNMQLSFQIALMAAGLNLNREVMIDGTLLGIGKGAGNLSTEVFLEYQNRHGGSNYYMSRIMNVVEERIRPLQVEFPWGYSVEYYLSAQYKVTPTYAKYYYREMNKSIDEVNKYLSRIPDHKKDSFDKEFAEGLLKK
ncbi:MAG: hypothetical protein K6B68_12215 [Eubacterium sp.]|nr:hypothetical protein [Eubacterium sp.]